MSAWLPWLYAGAGAVALACALAAAAACAACARLRAAPAWRAAYGGPPDGAQRAALASPARELSFQLACDAARARTVVLDTVLATCDPRLVAPLLRARAHSERRSWLYRALGTVLPSADGVLFLAGAAWRARHRAFTPLMASAAVAGHARAMLAAAVAEAEAAAAAQAALRRWRGGDASAGCFDDGGDALRSLVDGGRDLAPERCGNARCFAGGGGGGSSAAGAGMDSAHAHFRARRARAAPSAGVDAAVAAALDGGAAHSGPRPEEDLQTLVRWIAMRVLVGWALPLPLPPSPAPPPAQRLAACLARSLDAYARTVFVQGAGDDEGGEPAPAPSNFAILARSVGLYARLWRIAWDIRRCTDTLVDALAAARGPGAAPVAASGRSWGVREAATPALLSGSPPAPSLLSAMVDAGLSRAEIASEVNHLHGAHKAVAFMTTAALFELSQPAHAHWRAAVIAELEAACGGPPRGGSARGAPLADLLAALPAAAGGAAPAAAGAWRLPARADIDALPVLSRVWKETLRLHSVSLGTLRTTGEPLVDPATGATIPAGTDVQVLLHTLHTHPAHWGADALAWDPDRWLPGAPNGPRAPDVFFPFLDGLRRCAGMYLAETEAAAMLYALLVLYDTRVVFAPPAETPAAGADGESARRLARPWLARSAVAPAHASADASVAAADVAAAGNKVPPPAPPPGQPQRWRLRLRADMFSNFDGIVPYTIARRWDC